jgi:hypothetical protein
LQFSRSELKDLHIAESVLSRFEFRPGGWQAILPQSPGHTELERHPIVMYRDSAHLLLPTAVGSAITRLVIDAVIAMGLGDSFEAALAGDFAELFSEMPLLGGRSGAPITFQRIPGGRATGMIREMDAGRYLHLVLLVDGLAGFGDSGLNGRNQDSERWGPVCDAQLVRRDTLGRRRA